MDGNIRHDMSKCGLEDRCAQHNGRWERAVEYPELASYLGKKEEEEESLFKC